MCRSQLSPGTSPKSTWRPSIYFKSLSRSGCHVTAVARHRRQLLGGLVSLGGTLSFTHSCQAEAIELEEEYVADQPDMLDPSRKPSISTVVSIFGEEWLSLFSIATSVGLGAIAAQLKMKLDSAEDHVQNLEASNGSLKSQLHALNSEHSKVGKLLKDARKTVNLQSKQIQVERNESIRLDRELSVLQDNYSGKEKEVAQLNQKIVDNQAEASAQLEDANGKIESLYQNLEDTKSVLDDKTCQLKEVQRVLSISEEELSNANLHISDLDDQIRSTESSLAEERGRLVTLEKARVAAVADVKKLLSEQRNLTFDLKAETSTVTDLKQSLESKKIELADLREELLASVNNARAAQSRLTTAEHEAGQLKKEQLLLFANEKALNRGIEDLKTIIESQKNAITEFEQNTSQLKSCIEDKEAIINSLQADVSLKKAEIMALEALQQDSKLERSDLKKSLLKLKETEQIRKAERLKLEMECGELKKNLFNSQEAVDSLNADLLLKQNTLESYKRDLTRKQKDIATANQKLYSLKEKVSTLEAEMCRLAGVEKQLEKTTNEAAEVKEKLDAANRRTLALEESEYLLKEAKSNMRTLREEISTVQSSSRGELRKAKMQLSSSQAEVKDLKMSLDKLKKEVSEYKGLKKNMKKASKKPSEGTKISTDTSLNGTETPDEQTGGNEIESSTRASKTIAEARAQAVQIVEEMEDNVSDAIAKARKVAKESENAALRGLLAATSAQGEVERLQGSLASANEELYKKDYHISKLKSQISQLSNTTPEDEKHDTAEDGLL